jgi:hypothetical protein
MTPKDWLALAAAIVIAVLLSYGAQHYIGLQRAAAQNEVRGGVMTSTADGIERSGEIDQAQQAYNQGLAQARSEFERSLQEASRNEPSTRINADSANPDSVRAAARARRLARERLGCAGQQCEEGRPASEAAER